MKKLSLALILIAAFAYSAFAGSQDFILVNNTGYPIYCINISPSNSNDWEEDVLGSDILNNGDSVRVNFNAGNQQYWDIQAIFEDATSISWYGIDLLSTYEVTLNGDGTGRQHLHFIGNKDIKEDFRVQSGLKHHFLFAETGVASLSNKSKSELAKDIHI